MVAVNGTVNLYALLMGILGGPRSNHGSAFGNRDSYRAVHESAATVLYNTPFTCCPPPRCDWQCRSEHHIQSQINCIIICVTLYLYYHSCINESLFI